MTTFAEAKAQQKAAEERLAKQKKILRRKIACMVLQGLVARGTFFHASGEPSMSDSAIEANVDLAYRYANAVLAYEDKQ